MSSAVAVLAEVSKSTVIITLDAVVIITHSIVWLDNVDAGAFLTRYKDLPLNY